MSLFLNLFNQLIHDPNFLLVFKYLAEFSWIWLPLFLGVIFFQMWHKYIQTEHIIQQGSVLLEIKLPIEVTRSPLGIEIFLTALHQKGSPSWITTYWEGKIPPWFSLEMVSVDGKIHFYVWSPIKFKNIVEAQLYAHYPDIEIYEVQDYATAVRYDNVNTPIWGTYFIKSNEKNPHLPIKSYVDYGLDKADTKEEFKLDPMTSVLEFMGSIKKGEQIWIQILIQAHKKWGLLEGYLFKRPDWSDKLKRAIATIRKEATPVNDEGQSGFMVLSKGEQEKITALERSAGKFAFDCAVRGFYVTDKDSLDTSRFPGLIGSFRQYSSNFMNGFKLGWFTDFDYPWQDFARMRRTAAERGMLKAYKMRSFFHSPFRYWHAKPMIMTTEELATIWHLPGKVAETPTLSRISSKKAEAPANLPI